MSDRATDSGVRPGGTRGLCAVVRPALALRSRRHVDLCRTAAAICRS